MKIGDDYHCITLQIKGTDVASAAFVLLFDLNLLKKFLFQQDFSKQPTYEIEY